MEHNGKMIAKNGTIQMENVEQLLISLDDVHKCFYRETVTPYTRIFFEQI